MSIPMLNVLYFYISTSHSMCAVPDMAVFCNSLFLCSTGMMLRYCLSDFEMVPAVPFITGIAFVFIFYMCCIYFVRSLYLKIFSASFLFHVCLRTLQCQLTYIFLFHSPRLWCPVYCQAWFCLFALVDSIKYLPYLHALFQLIVVHDHTSVCCLILHLFPCIC